MAPMRLLVLLHWLAAVGAQQDCFSALADINGACCTGNSCQAGGSGVPDECSADCAAIFVPFFQDCRSTLDTVGSVDLSAFDEFYQGCDAVDGEGACEWASDVMAELEDARRQVLSLQRQAGALRSTACCEANEHWNGRFVDSAVCGFSPQQGDEDHDGHPDCIEGKNQMEAEQVCMSFGGRLCSVAELISGEASATGCGFDQAQVWSKTAGSWCDTPPQTVARHQSRLAQKVRRCHLPTKPHANPTLSPQRSRLCDVCRWNGQRTVQHCRCHTCRPMLRRLLWSVASAGS